MEFINLTEQIIERNCRIGMLEARLQRIWEVQAEMKKLDTMMYHLIDKDMRIKAEHQGEWANNIRANERLLKKILIETHAEAASLIEESL